MLIVKGGKMKKILVPVDGSEASQKSAQKAVEIGRLINAEITFVTVVNLPSEDKYSYFGMSTENAFIVNRNKMMQDLIQEETKMLDIIVRRLDCEGLNITKKIVVGKAAEEILKLAESESFDFIVMGRRGFSNFERLFIGSITQKVLASSTCPVMVINA